LGIVALEEHGLRNREIQAFVRIKGHFFLRALVEERHMLLVHEDVTLLVFGAISLHNDVVFVVFHIRNLEVHVFEVAEHPHDFEVWTTILLASQSSVRFQLPHQNVVNGIALGDYDA
jgi:hypothetical protein